MKRILTAVVLLVATQSSFAQFEPSKQVFNSPNLKGDVMKHKTVAILPFNATISYKRLPKNFDAAGNKAEEQTLSVNMQSGMYTYLLRKANDYTVAFQDVERTNALLKQHGVFDKVNDMTQDSVCKILGVDAVIKTSYSYARTGSEGGAIAKTILLGAGTGKVGSGALTMQINNGSNGEMIWRFYKEMNEDVMSSANAVMERMMRKVARNFPYEKS